MGWYGTRLAGSVRIGTEQFSLIGMPDLVLGKQGSPLQVLQIGKQCPNGCL